MIAIPDIEFEKLLEQVQRFPWNRFGWYAAISFVSASLVTNVISFAFIPNFTADNISAVDAGDDTMFDRAAMTDADLRIIYDRNLFNLEGKLADAEGSDPSQEAGSEAVKSDLPLKLTGIIYGGTPYNGLATIENTQTAKTNSFIVGDSLVKDAVISEIHRTRIFIERGKRKEFIELEQPQLVRTARQKKAQPAVGADGNAPIASGPALTKFKEEGFEREGNEMVMSQAYKQRMILGDLSKVLQDAKAVPNMVDNQIRGFRLERIREASIYQKAGFQNNDVVEEINGVLLTDPGSAIKQLRAMQNESEIDVVVKRNGVSMNLKLKVAN